MCRAWQVCKGVLGLVKVFRDIFRAFKGLSGVVRMFRNVKGVLGLIRMCWDV